LPDIYLYAGIAFVAGFLIAWILRTLTIAAQKKAYKSMSGFLESETLKKETLQKENLHVHQRREAMEQQLTAQLEQAMAMIREMDRDILLLQKSNEETEMLLEAKNPEVHALKLKLIEAQNTIARLKGAVAQ
jgi:hypothetical protein